MLKFLRREISTSITIIIVILCALLVGGVVAYRYLWMPKPAQENDLSDKKLSEEIEPSEKGTEEKEAILLADSTFEGKLVNQREELFKKISECTEEQFVSLITRMVYPETLTQQEKEETIENMEEAKRCIPSLKKETKEIGENIYTVDYVTTIPEKCAKYPTVIYEGVPYVVEVNLTSGTAKTVKGGIGEADRKAISQMMEELKSKNACILLASQIMGIPDVLKF